MVVDESSNATMRTVRFHEYGEPVEVLRMDRIAVPNPPPGRIRVAVHACGLNPADWALCRGLFPGRLPRGIGLELSGVVDAVGEGVVDVAVGDLVMGMADWAGELSAGASDRAIMNHWTRIPPGLDPLRAAALPMATETAYRSLEMLGVKAGHALMVHGAGTTVGFAAVQLALMRGARVVATTGDTYAPQLGEFGATVTAYGDGMVERVRGIVGETPDLILDTAPPSGVLPDLVRIAGGDPRRVLTVVDFAAAKELGVRDGFDEDWTLRYDMLAELRGGRWWADSTSRSPGPSPSTSGIRRARSARVGTPAASSCCSPAAWQPATRSGTSSRKPASNRGVSTMANGENGSSKSVVLVIGTTGQIGQLSVKEFDRDPAGVHVRLAARKPEHVERLRVEGRDAVLLDLDDPETFGQSLAGVDRLFLLTGYSVAMLTHSKTLVDAAVKASVRHVVRLGIFAKWDCPDPHFAWHQLVERYIEGSGLAWTHLHPNGFESLASPPGFIVASCGGESSSFCRGRDLARHETYPVRSGR